MGKHRLSLGLWFILDFDECKNELRSWTRESKEPKTCRICYPSSDLRGMISPKSKVAREKECSLIMTQPKFALEYRKTIIQELLARKQTVFGLTGRPHAR